MIHCHQLSMLCITLPSKSVEISPQKKKGHLGLILRSHPYILNDPLCILLRGNIPLCRNSVRILPISSERIGIYLTVNLAALIQVSIEAFDTTILKIWNICVRAHCSFSLLQYVIKQVSWHDMNLKLTLEILFDKWSSLVICQLDHGAFLNIDNSNKLQTL